MRHWESFNVGHGKKSPFEQTAGGSPSLSSHSATISNDEFSSDLPNPPIPEPQDSKKSSYDLNPFQRLAVSSTSRVRQVWAVGGGKGGVGKSLIAANLAIALARQGHRVIAVDLDLGGANLHTSLGVGLPDRTVSDFLNHSTRDLSQCLTPTGIQGLEIISGAQDSVTSPELDFASKVLLLQQARELPADYVVFDLGAGTHHNTIDFFLASDLGLITALPEPTSIENAYRFIKSAYYRRLYCTEKLASIQPLLRATMDASRPHGIRSPSDLFQHVSRDNPEAAVALKEEIAKMPFKLILNQVRTQTDVDIGFSMKSVCKKYFGIDLDYAGYLDHDSAVWQAIRRKRPLMLEFPNSPLVSSLEKITNYLVKRYGHVRNLFF